MTEASQTTLSDVLNTNATNREYTTQELINQLQRVGEKHGRPPRARDLDDRDDLASSSLIHHRFGSWITAIERAGFEPERVQTKEKSTDGDIHEIIWDVLDLTIELGFPPRKTDGFKCDSLNDSHAKRLFGSWNELLSICGLPVRTTGQARGARKDNYREYGPRWNQVRRNILKRDRYECQSCAKSYNDELHDIGTGLHVHHIIPLREFDDPEEANFPENLITLCKSCHSKLEGTGPSYDDVFGDHGGRA